MDREKGLKIILAGDGDVAKPALLSHFKPIKRETRETIGVRFLLIKVQLDDQEYILQLWDIYDDRRFKFLLSDYLTAARGAVLAFDRARPNTLERLSKWIDKCREINPGIPILLIGVGDNLGSELAVDDEYIHRFIDEFDITDYLKTSSKTMESSKKVFKAITRRVLSRES